MTRAARRAALGIPRCGARLGVLGGAPVGVAAGGRVGTWAGALATAVALLVGAGAAAAQPAAPATTATTAPTAAATGTGSSTTTARTDASARPQRAAAPRRTPSRARATGASPVAAMPVPRDTTEALPTGGAGGFPVGGAAAPSAATAPITGDGHVHAPSPLEAGHAPMQPNAVQTIVLRAAHNSVLQFPYEVKAAVPGDDAGFAAEKVENTVWLRIKDHACAQGCTTTLHVMLNDGLNTIIPYLLVSDAYAAPTISRTFDDPIAARTQARETAVRDSLASDAATYKTQLQQAAAGALEGEVERCISTGFVFKPVNRSNAWRDPNTGESMGVTAIDAGFSGRCLAEPRLYIRYAIQNARYTPLSAISLALVHRDRRGVTVDTVPILADRRAPAVVPALRQVRGALIVDGADRTLRLLPGETVWLVARLEDHDIDIGAVVTTPEAKP